MTAPISYPFSGDGVRAAAVALGTTTDAVARNLDAMGFKGCRGKEENCPAANYFLASITGAYSVRVMCGFIEVYDLEDNRITVEWTDAIEDFVTMFDLGRMPQLEVSDASS